MLGYRAFFLCEGVPYFTHLAEHYFSMCTCICGNGKLIPLVGSCL